MTGQVGLRSVIGHCGSALPGQEVDLGEHSALTRDVIDN